MLKTRPVTLFSGQQFDVPQCVQRIDTHSTHGWQVRYQGTKMFSDHTADGSGAARALAKAVAELKRRIAELPAPTKLQRSPSGHKRSDLPVGISGPIVRQRRGSAVRTAVLSVLLPRYGQRAQCCTVYIGTENTYTVERYWAALERAKLLRAEAEEAYRAAETQARRREVRSRAVGSGSGNGSGGAVGGQRAGAGGNSGRRAAPAGRAAASGMAQA